MLTVADALALGLPVYVRCEACAAPSRPIPLYSLDKGLDLETAAGAGRFRCRLCGGKRGALMPTLHMLLARRQRLRLECAGCGKDQAFTAAQACVLFGISTPFDDLRRRLRCREDCGLSVRGMGPNEALSKSGTAVLTLSGEG